MKLSVLAASCVLYSRTEYSQGFSTGLFKKESVKFPLHILFSIFKTNFISKANNCVISMHNTLLKYVTTSQSENVSNNLIG